MPKSYKLCSNQQMMVQIPTKMMHQVIMRKHVQILKILGEEFCRKVLKLELLIKIEKEIWILNLKHLKIYLVVPKNEAKNKRQFENGYLSN